MCCVCVDFDVCVCCLYIVDYVNGMKKGCYGVYCVFVVGECVRC